jgi:hypothetical protein
MLRFKYFSGTGADLDQAVNAWLSEFEPDVTQMTQTVDGAGGAMICFLYAESFRGQERRIEQEHGLGRAGKPAVPVNSVPDEPIHVPQEPGMITPEPR